MNCQHLVTLQDPDSDGRTYDGVHTRARSSHIQKGYVDITLLMFIQVIIRLNMFYAHQYPQNFQTFVSGRCT